MSRLSSDMTLATLASARRVLRCLTKIFTAWRVIFVSGVWPKWGRMWLRRWLR